MKYTLFLVVMACSIFVTTCVDETREQLAPVLARVFLLEVEEAAQCVRKTGATYGDISILEESISTNKKLQVDEDSLRRGSCVLTCCAQIKGMITGAKIQLEKVTYLIGQTNTPHQIKYILQMTAKACYEEVTLRNLKDACDVVREYVTCFIQKIHF